MRRATRVPFLWITGENPEHWAGQNSTESSAYFYLEAQDVGFVVY
jgi:hypothetical protein